MEIHYIGSDTLEDPEKYSMAVLHLQESGVSQMK